MSLFFDRFNYADLRHDYRFSLILIGVGVFSGECSFSFVSNCTLLDPASVSLDIGYPFGKICFFWSLSIVPIADSCGATTAFSAKEDAESTLGK